MQQYRKILYLILIAVFSIPAYAAQQGFYGLPGREGVQQPIWLIEPEHATHIVVLFNGGGGNLQINEQGIVRQGNFLIRTCKLFAEKGMVVAVMDKPTDRADLFLFRKTAEHAQDIKVVMQFLRKRYPGKPLWLVGTSRGIISVADVAARLHGAEGPDGIVLTSSITRSKRCDTDSLQDIDLSAIQVPTYVVHHKQDECDVTPYAYAESLLTKLTAVKVKEFKGVSGGESRGNPFQPRSYHGYLGIEEGVVNAIVEWIESHSPSA